VAELADALDLGSSAARRESSTLSDRTKYITLNLPPSALCASLGKLAQAETKNQKAWFSIFCCIYQKWPKRCLGLLLLGCCFYYCVFAKTS
jgi:hypothetical protein